MQNVLFTIAARRLIGLLGLLCFMTAFAEPTNMDLVKKEITAYHDSGQYEKELRQTIEQAQAYIVKQAEVNRQSPKPKKLALVLDIDETSLSNYDKIIQRDFSGNRQQIHKDIMLGNAPAIKPLLSLYNEARHQGVSIFFVTGRGSAMQEATIANLKKAGYDHWSGLYFRPANYNQASIIPYKTSVRAALTKEGYRVVASIGDQYSDIKGGYTDKGFKLPNPFYYIP
jgi:acid phosphatase